MADIAKLRSVADTLFATNGPMNDQEAVRFASDLSSALGADDMGEHASTWRLAIAAVGPTLGAVGAAFALMERLLPWVKDHILRRHGSNAEPCWEFTIEHRFVRDPSAPCGIRGIDSVFAPTGPLAIIRATIVALTAMEDAHG